MTLETMIGTLSRDEKLAAIDLIWRDLAVDSQSFVSPEWHEKVIADRLDNPVSVPSLPLAEAKGEIKEAISGRQVDYSQSPNRFNSCPLSTARIMPP